MTRAPLSVAIRVLAESWKVSGLPGVEQDLRASKQRDGFLVRLALHLGVPDLRGTAAMDEPRRAANAAFARRPEKIGFQLCRGESGCALGQRVQAAEAASTIGERHDARGVQESGRRQVMLS